MNRQRTRMILVPNPAGKQLRLFQLRALRALVKPKNWFIYAAFAGLILLPATFLPAQQPSPPAQPSSPATETVAQDKSANPSKPPTGGERRRAAKLFLQASKLFEKEQFEEALVDYRRAAKLDPSNPDYALAAELARSHAVTALLQSAVKDHNRSDTSAEREALAHALALDPKNEQVIEHLHELADQAALAEPRPLYDQAASGLGEAVSLAPATGVRAFHLHSDQRQAIEQVFKAYGIDATIDDSVRPTQVRFDLEEANFDQATRVLGLMTNSFYIPIDAHRALVARNTPENRLQFMRQSLETIYLPGLQPTELTDVGNIAKNIFELTATQAVVEPSAGTITVRAPDETLAAFNATVQDLIAGHNQVMLDVRLIQLAHTSGRDTGIQPPQQLTAFNVYAEEQSILNANQALVQQIISSGLAAPGDTLAILGILLASGQVSSSLFSNGVALFGGGLTLSGFSPAPITTNLNLNSSDSRELEQMQLRLGDGEAGTVRTGTKYPIQTSSFSSLSASIPSIPGLTSPGSSSALSSLLAGLSSVPNVPQVQYQDLGLTLKATPKVLRNDDVALTLDLKIDALAGSSLNGNPILANRSYSGVITLREGEGAVLMSELDKQETRALSGLPGLTEIPGLNNVTANNTQKSASTLVIVITPHVVRGTQPAGRTAMMRVEPATTTRVR
ncbi:MAG: tetratricopeptide repeat protein [Terracidiphilus sp.]